MRGKAQGQHVKHQNKNKLLCEHLDTVLHVRYIFYFISFQQMLHALQSNDAATLICIQLLLYTV